MSLTSTKTRLWHTWQRTIRGRVAVMVDPNYDDGPADPVTLAWYAAGCPEVLACPWMAPR